MLQFPAEFFQLIELGFLTIVRAGLDAAGNQIGQILRQGIRQNHILDLKHRAGPLAPINQFLARPLQQFFHAAGKDFLIIFLQFRIGQFVARLHHLIDHQQIAIERFKTVVVSESGFIGHHIQRHRHTDNRQIFGGQARRCHRDNFVLGAGERNGNWIALIFLFVQIGIFAKIIMPEHDLFGHGRQFHA